MPFISEALFQVDLAEGRSCLPRSLSDLDLAVVGDNHLELVIHQGREDLERCRLEQV